MSPEPKRNVRTFMFAIILLSALLFLSSWIIVRRQPTTPGYQYALPEARLDDITVLIKTLNRRDKVEALVKSIQRFYGSKLDIIIADDGWRNESDEYEKDVIGGSENIKYFYIGFDRGLSAGRNYLVRMCNTTFAFYTDDDMVWTERTDIKRLLYIIHATTADIVTISLEKYANPHYFAELYKIGRQLFFCGFDPGDQRRCANESRSVSGRCYQTHIGLNVFLARTDVLRKNPWNEKMKLGEHELYFYNLRDQSPQVRVVGCADITCVHDTWSKTSDSRYMELRHRASAIRDTEVKIVEENLRNPICCAMRQNATPFDWHFNV